MTKKRKKYPNLEQKLERPWCYYCERDFDDLKILISHQKAKHFKCDRCGRRLNTAGGLSVHMNQVHKENLSHVENAIAGRQGLEIEIFGMEGVPADVLDAHNQTVTQKHFAEEAERARLTGNPIRGAFQNGSAPPNKRPKVSETTPDIETRAEKYRFDRQNGTLPDVPPQQTTVRRRSTLLDHVLAKLAADPKQNTPSTAQQPYPAPFSPANAGFPAPAGAPPVQYAIPGRPSSVPQQPGAGLGALPPRPGFANGDASAMASSLDDLIGQARKEAVPGAPAPGAAEAKEEKKKKSANIRLIFYDESVSPEEKMALLPRFAGFAR